LTRRPIILLCLLVFVGAGIAAFFKLNIEAYPNELSPIFGDGLIDQAATVAG
jgi:multidrug efflux pump subunit AcrB